MREIALRKAFTSLVNEAEDAHKGPDIFWRRPALDVDELRVLRRWNSHSPALADVLGGGYFLRWKGRGTVVDPGCSFLRLFRHCTEYSFRDIDMVVVTHDHVDHCQDFGALMSVFRQFNRWLVRKGADAPRVWDMIMSFGVAEQYVSLLNHPDNAPFVFWRKVFVDRRQKIDWPQDVPAFLREAEKKGVLRGDPYLHAFLQRASAPLTERYSYELEALPAIHKELLGASTAFGLRFALRNPTDSRAACTVAISGDTAIGDRTVEVLRRDYGEADLLVLHVGGMGKPGPRESGDHLCFQGVIKILKALAADPSKLPKLVILTEWGYEFGRLGLDGRTQFTRYVADELNNCAGLKAKFHAAVATPNRKPPRCTDEAVVILPADIGLRLRLTDLAVFVESPGAQGGFHDYRETYAAEQGERIDYLAV